MVKHVNIAESADETEIQDTLKTHFKIEGTFNINEKGLISVYGHCSLIKQVVALPVRFKMIVGKFDCSNSNLTSLQGSPRSVYGSFHCRNNELTSLKGGPIRVEGDYLCDDNELATLQGAPLSVGGSFSCASNNLTTLLGGPQSVGGSLYCYYNRLTSLDGLPNLFTLIHIDWNESLPLLRLVGKKVTFSPVMVHIEEIINNYVSQGTRANIVACQKELIDAGYEGNATW